MALFIALAGSIIRTGGSICSQYSVCHEVFKGDDLIKIDFINTLTHYTCLDLGIDLIKNIDTFGNIKMEYPFLSE